MSQFKEDKPERNEKKKEKRINWEKELELLKRTKDLKPKDAKAIDIIINVGYTDDVDTIFSVINKVMKDTDKLLREPRPELSLGDMDNTNVQIHVKPFCHKDDYWEAMMLLLKNLKFRLFKEGISYKSVKRAT
jgi:small-conductance mechanosensitive channel